ncbi:hypothetical protein B0A54_15511 [Friedmanniomyces endolithicus]|uniref:Filamentation protein n=1 Tax=Friedmanniomyces endolithicus TaxID=329885 RepID=A0A4U0U4P4_9PEZI|nr:hypothetical protein LTS09_013392 [Friedmanniomyces endolithicus]TKA29958.1 hypothetical protein B0A54_15511 [Friedmanniomyces endolithicus]
MSVAGKAPNPEKGKRYFAQLDQALCNGSWAEVPELARKTDKHAPERGCFTLAARTEAQIASASHRPTSASSAGTSSIHSLGEAIPRLQEVIASGKSAPDDAYVARACLAEIHWLQEDSGTALKVLPQQDLHTAVSNGQTAALGWLEVCVAKVAFIRAAALEANGRGREVQEVYRAAVVQTPGSRSPELRRWTERLLARVCMSDYTRTSQPTLATLTGSLVSFRAWISFWQRASPQASGSVANPNRLDVPRRQVWKAYYSLLSMILSHDLLYNVSANVGSDLLLVPRRAMSTQQYMEAKIRQRAELKRVETTYESLLLNETQFPKASQTNAEVELWIEQAVINWRTLSSADWSDEELGDGGKATLGRDMLDILYRAATKTFHSNAILRQLFNVHAALGEYDLAIHAFNSYAEIVGRRKAKSEKTGLQELGSDDDDDAAILTASEAVRVLCKYGDREQAEKALEIGERIKEWLGWQRSDEVDELETTEDVKTGGARPADNPVLSRLRPDTLACAHRANGISEAHWAHITCDTDVRASLLKNAASSLRRSRSYDETDPETAYVLARVLAESQNVPAAIEITKRAIAAANASQADDDGEREHYIKQRQLVPLWHLLALCLTTRDEHDAAIKMCNAAFDQFGESTVLFGRQGMLDSNTRSRAQRGLVDSMDDFEKEGLLQVKMTELTLIELTEGAERAADFSDEVLRLYARLFGNPEQLKSASKPPQTAASMAPPPTRGGGGTLRSIAGSIRPKSARNSVERDTSRQVTSNLAALPETSLGRQTATNGQVAGPPISITVTNEDGVSAEKGQREHHNHHLHMPFKMRGHHGDFREAGSMRSKKSAEDLNEKSDGARDSQQVSPPVPPKDTAIIDHAQTAVAPESIAPDAPTSAQQPLKVINHNRPPDDWPAPLGHEREVPEQDVRLPAPYPPATSHGLALPNMGSLHVRQHMSSILVKVWLFVAALYVRASFFEDAGGAVEEAQRLVEAFEREKSAQNANSLTLFQKGWGGGKSVDELWADVWSVKGDLAVSRELPFEAMEHYEQALTYFPDHLEAIIGLSDMLMDIYEEKMPAEEPEPPLIPSNPAISSQTSKSANPPPPRLTTAKSSFASAGREPPPNARSKDPTPAQLNRLAARDRAYMLLSTLTKLGSGWDSPEAWFALARAHELSGEVGRAKKALWWVVEVGESRGVRGWGESVGGGGYCL